MIYVIISTDRARRILLEIRIGQLEQVPGRIPGENNFQGIWNQWGKIQKSFFRMIGLKLGKI